jgi:hypothetical protein
MGLLCSNGIGALLVGLISDGDSSECGFIGLIYSSELPKAGTVGAGGGETARRGLVSGVGTSIVVEK